MTNSLDLHGQTALVCGASQGIGEATARLLAERGARVIALARNADRLKTLVSQLPGVGHEWISTDLSEPVVLGQEAVPQIQKWGPTILVNNSGGPKGGPLMESRLEEFEQALKGHVMASQLLVKACFPSMKSHHFGRIINIISTSVKAPIHNLGVSNTIRAAMANWSKTLSQELGPFGITVNNVLPGYTKTARFEALRAAASQKLAVSETEIENQWKATIPLHRFAEPREVAEAVAFLASPAASYISGVNLPVDGGRTPSL